MCYNDDNMNIVKMNIDDLIVPEWYAHQESCEKFEKLKTSTLMACEQSGKNCFMMECNNRCCKLIIDRWEKLTGKKSRKI